MIISRIGKALLICGLSIAAISCNKNDDDDVEVKSDSPIVAGIGGPATLFVIPQHKGVSVDSCMIYLKYNTGTRPLNGAYDDSAKVTMVDGQPTARFWYLHKGSYFVYGVGYDPYISKVVKGGTAYKILTETSSLNMLNLPVTVDGQ